MVQKLALNVGNDYVLQNLARLTNEQNVNSNADCRGMGGLKTLNFRDFQPRGGFSLYTVYAGVPF